MLLYLDSTKLRYLLGYKYYLVLALCTGYSQSNTHTIFLRLTSPMPVVLVSLAKRDISSMNTQAVHANRFPFIFTEVDYRKQPLSKRSEGNMIGPRWIDDVTTDQSQQPAGDTRNLNL